MTPKFCVDLIDSQGQWNQVRNTSTEIPEQRPNGGLLHLPPDILLLIFESLATFSDVQALVLTSHTFYKIWRTHCWTIYANLLPQLIHCYSEAEQLAACQEHEIRKMAVKYQCLAQGLFMSTRGLSLMPDIKGIRMKPSENERFHRAFYNFWTFNLADEFHWPSILRQMSLKQFYPMYELAFWIDSMKEGERAALNGLFEDSTCPDWKTCWSVIDTYWRKALNFPLQIGQIRVSSPISPRGVEKRSCFFDEEQNYFMSLPFDKSKQTLDRFSRTPQATSGTTSSPFGIQVHEV